MNRNNNNNNNNNNSSLKPEYVLKRVNDLINSAVGNNEKEKRFALEQLHSVIGVKRKGVWTKVYESLMKRHLELCVDLKDHHTAKDGLHQYRNLCQSVDPNSLEVVILYLMELSEERATAARQKADKVSLAAAARVSDLDQEETPESIMLSSMTEEGAKDRTDREVVVPWLKFLWENYRAILELLYKLPKLEKTYHKTCEKAFKFCLDYSRIMEFRRLCEMLRQQLSNLQKTPVAGNQRNARPQWEWTTEAIDFHLQTRFSQLEVATTLELWNEGFRTVEDIYAIIVSSKKQPKAKLMVTYYEKLTRIFWVSENKLFHAYAWYRYYCLACDTRKDLKAEEKTLLASSVLLAALTIPSIKDIYSTIAVDDDEVVVEKNSQMALLLDFQSQPSRQALLNDIVNRGLLTEVLPELARLFECLEAKFQPTSLVKNITAAVTAIKAYPTLTAYSLPLQRIIVIKVVQQLSRVYKTVRIDFVNKLLSGLSDLSANQIEKIIIEGVSSKQLSLKINHSNSSIEFAAAVASASAVDVQVSQLGAQLNRVANIITDALGSTTLAEQRSAARRDFLNTVLEAAEEEYSACIERKALIERRKEGLERLAQEKQKEEKRVKDVEEARRKKEEDERLQKEEYARSQEKKKKLNEKLELTRVQKELEKHGVVMEESAIAELDAVARRALIMDAQSESQKAKDDENRRMVEQARRLDHITRALRIEGAAAIVQKYAAQVEEDKKIHAAREVERQAALSTQHATDVAEKQRLARMQAHRSLFEEALLKKQRAEYERRVAKMRQIALNERRDQNIARARRLFHEELERQEEEEERQREAEAKVERDRIEREQAEALRKQREIDEALEKDRESNLENMRKAIAAAESKGSAAPGAASAASAGGAGGYRPPSQRAGPSASSSFGPPQGGASNSRFGGPSSGSTPQKAAASESEGGWRRAGPPPAAPAPAAAAAAAAPSSAPPAKERDFGFGPSSGSGSAGGRWVSQRAQQAESAGSGGAGGAGPAAAPKSTSDWKRSGPSDNKDSKPAPTRARW